MFSALALALVLVSSVPVRAGSNDGPIPVTEESRAAARELMAISGQQQSASQMLDLLRNNLVGMLKRNSPKPVEEIGRIVDQVLLPEFKAHLGELSDAMVEVWASHYTVDEMHQLADFYRSPLGRRVIEVSPQIAALGFTAGQIWGQRVSREALQKQAEELRRRGLAL